MLRIAHLSDLHVLAPAGVQLRRILFSKRVTGYVNLLAQRGRVYRPERLLPILTEAARRSDHLVITGDITNLSLEGEYEEARSLLDRVARSVEVTVVPGNHDIYLPSVRRERRFPHHFARFMRSDLPDLALDLPAGRFPFVKLRGAAAIIGLSSAVPRPPFVSAGILGQKQLGALAHVLAHPEVARRTPVLLVHHSPFDDRFRLAQLRGGLVDAPALRKALSSVQRGLLLYGHLHRRRWRRLPTAAGSLDAVCSTAAALDHPSDRARAGFNLYAIGDDGSVRSIESLLYEPADGSFQTIALDGEGAGR